MRLSRLQRVILALALKNPRKGRVSPFPMDRVDVTPAAVKVAYYGFPLSPKGRKIFFNKSEVGRDRYNNAAVAIARAFDHLARKGLVERVTGWGLQLTEKGREVAVQLRND